MGRLAAAISSAARAMAASGAAASFAGCAGGCDLLVGGCERHVLRQIEMHRPLRLAQGEPDGLVQCLDDAPPLERQRCLGDRLEQRMVIDPHLNAPAELIGVEVAGDRDHRRAVEIGRADAGREVGRARSQGRDAKPGRAGHAAGHVGGEAGRAFVGRQHEFDPALAHRLHQRQHVAARDPEAASDAVGLQRCNDQIGVVHAMAIIICRGPEGGGIICVRCGCCRAENRRGRINGNGFGPWIGRPVAGA